jgi:hypothetical protein
LNQVVRKEGGNVGKFHYICIGDWVWQGFAVCTVAALELNNAVNAAAAQF